MKWIKWLYRAYMDGYKANCFPISEYGFFGERYKRQDNARKA